MRGWLVVAGLGLVGYALFGGKKRKRVTEPAPPLTPPRLLQPGDHVGLVGDSLAVGLGAPLRDELDARGMTLDVRAQGATVAPFWADQPMPPDTVATLVVLGTNDCLNESRFCMEFADNLVRLGDKIGQGGAEPVFVAMPPMPWEPAPRMDAARIAMQDAGGTYVPPPPFDVPRSDGIHPTGEGYRLWAEYIVEELAGPKPAPQLPTAPPGWRPLRNQELTDELRAKAREVLNSAAPMGSMNPFVASDGQAYGAFVTVHPGTVRAVEIWRPA